MFRRLLTLPGILLVGGITASAMMSAGCGKGSAPPPPQAVEQAEVVTPPPPPTPPPPKPIRLATLNAVTLDPGGQTTVDLKVERNGNEGAIQVQLDAAPEGVSIKFSEIPAGQSVGKLEVAAAEKLGDEPVHAMLNVTVKVGDAQTSQPLALTVNKLNLPNFLPAVDLVLLPGATSAVNLAIERNGYAGPLELRVEGLPEKVSGKVAGIPAGQNETKLEVTAAADAPDAKQTIRVAATLLGRPIGVDVPLQIDKRPYTVNSLMVVTLKPGESKSVKIPVQRRSYKGPIQLETLGLSEGVTAAKVELAAGQSEAALELTAAGNAKEHVRSARVVSTAGQLTRTDPLVVRVSHGEGGLLPREITADPEHSPLLRRGSFGGRLSAENKQALLDAYGGTEESEEAVLRGLRWLAAHQQADGRWPLKDYSKGIYDCDCWTDFEKEVVDYDNAGTAFGLLPFLGAGIAHNRAPEDPPELAQYQKAVENGLGALMRNQVKSGSLGGNLYAHGIGTMALCEAYGISGDDRLKLPAQLAIKYLLDSQHPEGGGWRYSPKQAGDMSATGWMFLAIRYGQLAGLTVLRPPLARAERFLDSCAAGPEEAKLSRYAYQPDQPAKLSLTAAGLLTRQYLGWKQDNADLLAGCKYMMQNLPPESGDQLGQIYYYYYATQVLHHMEGSDFDLWNHRMREHLIRTQQRKGHQAGSWNAEGSDWGNRGGRLYSTSMALMTLQVYYRHLPMYRTVQRVRAKSE